MRKPTARRVATLCIGLAALPAFARAAEPVAKARPAGNPVMLAFARAMRGLDAALQQRDPQAIGVQARALLSAAEDSFRIEPQKNADRPDLFQQYRSNISTLSSAVAVAAQQQDLERVAERMHEVRKTCMLCHLTFRKDEDVPPAFPRDRNIVAGEVRLLDQNGNVQSERSNVVVFLDGSRLDGAFKLAARHHVVSQHDRAFVPRVLPILKGSTVEFPNDDTIFHNVFSLSQAKSFDLDVYQPGESRGVAFNNSGVVKLYCNIHPQMVANIVVLENPYFCTTNSKGVFVISGVPDGVFSLRTWQEFACPTSQRIEVGGDTLQRFALEIHETVKSVAHNNKFGQPYRTAY